MAVTSVVSGEQAALQICTHFFSSRLHAFFALLNLAALGWFLYSAPRAPRLLRGLIGGATAFAVAFHALLVTPVQAHAQFSSFQTARIRMLVILVESLFASAVAAHFVVLKSEGAGRTAKLFFLSVVAVVGMVAMGWWWALVTEQTSVLSTLPLSMARLSAAMLLCASAVFVYSATKSRALAIVLCMLPPCLTAFCALNAAFPFDIKSRHSHSDLHGSQRPHWSVAARCFTWATYMPAVRAAISHAIVVSQQRVRVARVVTLAADVSCLPRQPKASEWLSVSALVALAAAAVSTFGMHPSSGTSSTWNMRDLPLDIDLSTQDIGLLCWFLFCGVAVLAIWGTSDPAGGEQHQCATATRNAQVGGGAQVVQPSIQPQQRHGAAAALNSTQVTHRGSHSESD